MIHMELKKILILFVCLVSQFGYIVYGEDITQNQDYKNAIQKAKQINSGVPPVSQTTNLPISAPTPQIQVPPSITSVDNTQPQIVIPQIPNTKNEDITIPTFVSDNKLKYKKILEANGNLLKNNNKVTRKEYINAVEDYRNKYGDYSLKYENLNNYIPIMNNLGLAYEKDLYLNEAINVYEILIKEKPTDIKLKEKLLFLYDDINLCDKAKNMFNQIKRYEPSYNVKLVNCGINNTNSYNNGNYNYKNTVKNNNTSSSENNSGFGDFWWWYIAIIAGYFAIKSFVDSIKINERTTSDNLNQTTYHNQYNSEINTRIEYEEKESLREEYRRKQLVNEQREQELKQREYEKQKRDALIRTQRLQKNYWYNLDPYKFEEEIGELFKNLGYNVTVTSKSGDGGIDIIIEKDSKIKVVQCKRYKGKVGAPEVQAFWGAKDYFEYKKGKFTKADGAILVALSGVTNKAKKIIQHFPTYELWTIDTILAKAREVNYNYS